MSETFDITKHELVPKHIKLSAEDADKVLKDLNVGREKLPMIFMSDSAIQNLKPEVGDIIKIERASPTNIETVFYRVVVYG
jgi:DNA-directed RNA polymerase subunit H